MIKYLGSKRLLLPLISETIASLSKVRSVIDLFSGTARVGHKLKQDGFQVFSNDLNTYAATLARCYVQANLEDHEQDLKPILKHLNELPGEEGYFTETFCKESRFFQPKNGARIDSMREWIHLQNFEEEREAILLTSLMEAADRVDSTTGLQMAYLKSWAPRAHKDLELRMSNLLKQAKNGKGKVVQLEAREAARVLSADLAYLDPPYNQHKYLGNYHIWESLVRWDKPEFYGVACKRIDVRERKSAFNRKREIYDAMKELLSLLDVRHLVVSFSDEGYLSKEDLVELLQDRGAVRVLETNYKRYVGAQIGVHNPEGKKVGEVSHLRNREYLFVVSDTQ